MSERTLRRWAHAYWRFGIAGCTDGRTVRKGGNRAVTEPVREAIYAVRQETLHRSKLSMATRDRLIRQYVAERHGPEVAVPSYWTLKRTWPGGSGRAGPGGGTPVGRRRAADRQAYGAAPARPGRRARHTVLPVKVRESVFGEPVSRT